MFTGIVEEIGKVSKIVFSPVFQLEVRAEKTLENLKISDSICVNGVCLTVTSKRKEDFVVQVMTQTLKKTNLGFLKVGDEVNLERALTPTSFMGGHFVTGDIDGLAKVEEIKKESSQWVLSLKVPSGYEKYIVPQGRVTLQGVSLTVADKKEKFFQVCLIPYTLSHTTLKNCKRGDLLNLEVDILAKYMDEILKSYTEAERKGVTFDFLRKAGY